ncbi:MAG: addiction module protein [Planctomycetia bacterium]|nr:addiction module protein [Planctomycetia bacterium]
MTDTAARLLAEALNLSESDRGDLAARLIQSLEPSPDADVDSAWAEEIKRRVEDYHAGRAETLSWPEARRMIVDDANDSVET